MAEGHQSEAIAGSGPETTYGNGVVVSRYRPFLSETISAKRDPIMSQRKQGGGGGKKFGREGPVVAGGGIVEELLYDLTTDPVDDLLRMVFGAARGHWYRRMALTGASTAWIALRHGANDNVELADQVTPAVAVSAAMTVRRRLRRIGSPIGANNEVWIELQTDTAGAPSGTTVPNGTSAKLSALSVTLDPVGDEYEFSFTVSPSLAAGAPVHIVLKGDYAPSATDQIQMLVENVASGGTLEIKDMAYADDATKNGIGRGLTTSLTDSYIMAKSSRGLSSSLAVDKGPRVHQHVGIKTTSVAIASKPKEGVTISYEVLARTEQMTASTNAAQLAALPVQRGLLIHSDLTVLLGPQTMPLTAGDAVEVSSVEWKLARPMDQLLVSGTDLSTEPRESDERDCTLTLAVPRYLADTYKNYALNKTPLQAKLQWTDGSKFRSLLLPNGRIMGNVEIPTDGVKAYSQAVTIVFGINEGANLFMPIQYEAEMYLGAA